MHPLRRHTVSLGDRFGRWTVVSDLQMVMIGKLKQGAVECLCECGNRKFETPKMLCRGHSKSCGCLRHDQPGNNDNFPLLHGESRHPTSEYRSWLSMKGRCLKPHSASYFRYGAVGITICDEWVDSYETFLTDMGRKPTPQHTIDRIDGSKGYYPANCRWATKREQAQNRSSTTYFTLGDVTLPVIEWARKLGIHKSTILVRIRNGWTLEDALTTSSLLPRGKVVHGSQYAYSFQGCRCDVCRNAVAQRMREYRARKREEFVRVEEILSTPLLSLNDVLKSHGKAVLAWA